MEIISMWGSLSFGVDVTIYTFRYKSVEFVCPWFFKFCSLCMFRLPRSFQLHLFDKFFQQISVFHFTLILDFSGFSSSYFWTPLLFKSKTKTKIWYFVYQNNGMAATVWDSERAHRCWCMRDWTRGRRDTVRESALNVFSGRKLPCHTGDSNPRQYCAWLFSPTVYQLSYPAVSNAYTYSFLIKTIHSVCFFHFSVAVVFLFFFLSILIPFVCECPY